MQLQNKRWMWYLLPSQITSQGLSTVIPLYVIFLGGDIGEVAIISALQNGSIAIGSLTWGKIIDRFHSKRPILVTSFFFVLLCSLGMYFTNSIYVLYGLATVLGFFMVAKSPVTQLLVMESVQKNLWSWLFAKTSIISTLGMLVAMIIGTVGSFYFDLRPYFLICAVSSGISLVLSTSVRDSDSIHIERSSIAHSLHGIRYSISHHHFVFPKILEVYDFRHIITLFKGRISNEIGIFYLASFFFYFGSNMYLTAWTPFLKNQNFSNADVFLNYTIQMIAMLLVFFIAPKIISKLGEERSTILAHIPRILAVMIPAVSLFFMVGTLGFPITMTSACMMVIAFSIYSTSSSVIFFKSIPQGFEGKYLGVNSAITGIGVFVGSFVTGELTKFLGYATMFLSASAVLVVSLVLYKIYFRYRLSNNMIT
ncbi:MAG: MFS transporter [Thaumarchaeota archaeon]|nr:MFS transporter [Nitrososphaerota archaeon]MDE1832625.1 MFS transporter [Nitrososphaerota archaeon]MDE1878578.1 MFS transporter [Nitrososphaerota archaeon]